jgi:hypothetical protein
MRSGDRVKAVTDHETAALQKFLSGLCRSYDRSDFTDHMFQFLNELGWEGPVWSNIADMYYFSWDAYD